MATMTATPKFDLIPDVPMSSIPNYGVPAGQAGLFAALPALGQAAGLGCGNPATGQALGALLSIPGQVAEYKANQQAARVANQQRQQAIQMVENLAASGEMNIGRPAEWTKINPRVDATARMAAARRAWAGKSAEEQERVQAGIAGQGGVVTPAAEAAILGAVEERNRIPMQQELGQIWQSAQEDSNNLLMAIASADTARKMGNAANKMGLTQLAAGLLTGDISFSSAQQIFSTVTESMNRAMEIYQQRWQMQKQMQMQQRALNYGLAGSGISAVGSIAGGALVGGAFSGGAGGGFNSSPFISPSQTVGGSSQLGGLVLDPSLL